MQGELTDLKLRALKPSGREFELREGDGFGVRVRASGEITFELRYRSAGKKWRLRLGRYRMAGTDAPVEMTLKEARKAAEAPLAELRAGRNPIEEQRKREAAARAAEADAQRAAEEEARALSVRGLAEEWIRRYVERERKRPDLVRQVLFGSDKHGRSVLHALGARKARDVKRADIVAMLETFRDRGALVMANRALSITRQMFAWALSRELAEHNPCDGLARSDAGGKEKARERALDEGEIRILWQRLDAATRAPRKGSPEAVAAREAHEAATGEAAPAEPWLSEEMALAFKLLLATGQRRGELIRARWAEVDSDGKTWTLPASNMKSGKAHRVPLSPLALRLFEALKKTNGKSDFVLPAPDGKQPITERALSRAAARIQAFVGLPKWVPHDLRRTLATRMNALGVAPHVVEKILAHELGGVLAIYNRHDYASEMRRALNLWGVRIEALTSGKPAEVRSLAEARGRRARTERQA